jgi:hypothetical protein
MSDSAALFLILAAIYFSECLFWVRRDGVAFLSFLARRWRLAHPGTLIGNRKGGLLLSAPLPPLGVAAVCPGLPLALSPQAVGAWPGENAPHGGNDGVPPPVLAFDRIRSIDVDGKKILLNGEPVADTVSPASARRLAEEIRGLTRLAPRDREEAIRTGLRESMSLEAIEERLARFREHSKLTRVLCNVLFAHLFLLSPALVWYQGLARWWALLLGGALGLMLLVFLAYRRSHARLYPADGVERRRHLTAMALSPPAAIRAHDLLARPLLERFHPLAVAKAVCPSWSFEAFARRVLLDLRLATAGDGSEPACDGQNPVLWFRREQLRIVQERLLGQEDPARNLMERPPPREVEALAFCPRCHTQFRGREGSCPDCGGLELRPF